MQDTAGMQFARSFKFMLGNRYLLFLHKWLKCIGLFLTEIAFELELYSARFFYTAIGTCFAHFFTGQAARLWR